MHELNMRVAMAYVIAKNIHFLSHFSQRYPCHWNELLMSRLPVPISMRKLVYGILLATLTLLHTGIDRPQICQVARKSKGFLASLFD